MKKLITAFLIGCILATGAAFANKQNHHCKMEDGSMDMKKTKKECHKAKGKWVKDEAPAKPAAGK